MDSRKIFCYSFVIAGNLFAPLNLVVSNPLVPTSIWAIGASCCEVVFGHQVPCVLPMTSALEKDTTSGLMECPLQVGVHCILRLVMSTPKQSIVLNSLDCAHWNQTADNEYQIEINQTLVSGFLPNTPDYMGVPLIAVGLTTIGCVVYSAFKYLTRGDYQPIINVPYEAEFFAREPIGPRGFLAQLQLDVGNHRSPEYQPTLHQIKVDSGEIDYPGYIPTPGEESQDFYKTEDELEVDPKLFACKEENSLELMSTEILAEYLSPEPKYNQDFYKMEEDLDMSRSVCGFKEELDLYRSDNLLAGYLSPEHDPPLLYIEDDRVIESVVIGPANGVLVSGCCSADYCHSSPVPENTIRSL